MYHATEPPVIAFQQASAAGFFGTLRQHRVFLLCVFALAVGLRIAVAAKMGLSAPPRPGTDDAEYDQYALNLVEGRGFSGYTIGNQTNPDLPTTFREPGTPFVYAILFNLFGHRYEPVRIVQCLFSAAVVFFLFYLANCSFGLWAARISAVWYALYPATWVFCWHTTSESQFTFLLYAFAVSLVGLARRPTLRNVALTGLLFGVASLTRAGMLLLAPFMWVWAWSVFRPAWRVVIGVVLGIGLAALLVVLPWTLRNYQVQDEFVLICTRAGETFLQGNNEYVVEDPVFHGYTMQTVEMARYHEGLKGLAEVERDHRAFEMGWQFLRENTKLWPRLAAWKLVRQWTPLLQRHVSLSLRLSYLALWGSVLILGAIGFVRTLVPLWRRRDPFIIAHLSVLMICLNAVVFFGFARYRLPYEGFYIVLASVGLLELLRCASTLLRRRDASETGRAFAAE